MWFFTDILQGYLAALFQYQWNNAEESGYKWPKSSHYLARNVRMVINKYASP